MAMLTSLREWYEEDKQQALTFGVAALALLLSFFDVRPGGIDPAWITVLLCGVPILREAGEGLWKRFDIKADVLVSLALIASVLIDEIFAAGEVAFIMQLGSMLEERTVAGRGRASKSWCGSRRARPGLWTGTRNASSPPNRSPRATCCVCCRAKPCPWTA